MRSCGRKRDSDKFSMIRRQSCGHVDKSASWARAQKTSPKGLVLGAFPGDLCHAMGMSHTVLSGQKWVYVSDGGSRWRERRKWHKES